MDDAVRIFRERGFDLLIAEAQIAAAEGDATAAGAFANPQLSASAGRSFDYDPRACPGCSATAGRPRRGLAAIAARPRPRARRIHRAHARARREAAAVG